MIKVSLTKVLDKISDGVRRFWPCHLCTVLAADLFVLVNHDWMDGSAMLNAMWGIFWGALAGVFARLVCEWRGISKGNLVSGIVTVVVGLLGEGVWFAIGETSLWIMLYSGVIVALLASCMAVLYTYADGTKLFSRLSFNALGVCGSTLIFAGSLMLCLMAFDGLVLSISDRVFVDVWCVVCMVMVPMGFLSFLPGKDRNETDTPDRATEFLFWLLLPASLLLLGILYLYLGKILVTWSLPSGRLNWFGSISLAAYVFFWLSLRGSARKFFRLFARWGWALLLPVLVAQIVGIVVRYQAYGLSTPRFAGMITLAFGVYALVLAALDRPPRSLFVVIAVSGLVFTVTPLNIIDVPLRNQEGRLRAALERNGLLKDGALNLSPDIQLSDTDIKTIAGAWGYLVPEVIDVESFLGPMEWQWRPVWHRMSLTKDLRKKVEAARRSRELRTFDLLDLLGVDEDRRVRATGEFREKDVADPWRTVTACVQGDSRVFPISGYTDLMMVGPYGSQLLRLPCRKSEGRWWLDDVPVPDGDTKLKFDVTDHVVRLFDSLGWNGVIADGLDLKIKPADTIWEIRPGMALIFSSFLAYGNVRAKVDYLELDLAAILTKPVGQEN